MALPTSRSTTYVNDELPAIDADDLNDMQDWLVYLYANRSSGAFGDGSDGDVTLDGSVAAPSWASKSSNVYTMTRSAYCNNLTLSGTAVLKMKGFRLFVRNTLTTSGGELSNDGNAAVNETGGAGITANIVKGSENGALGGAGVGPNGNSATTSLGGAGGNGGAGLSGAGTGGTSSSATIAENLIRAYSPATLGAVLSQSNGTVWINGGAGGGAGGGGGGSNLGGGGGGGAGVIAVAARTVILLNAANLHAIGGVGGDGDSTCGGGGGGGGGVLILVSETTSISSGTLNVATCCIGGAGGAAGIGGGTFAGSTGASGNVYLVSLAVS